MDWKSANLPETFRRFKQMCQFIFDGPLEKKTEIVKIQYLMLWVGEEGRDIRDGWQMNDDDKKLLRAHWERFKNYVKPKSNFRVARFQLRALRQEPNESVDAFMTRAKRIASECEYTDRDEQLLDTLITGVSHELVQRKLISKGNTLTLDQAMTIVWGFGATQKQMNDIHGAKAQTVQSVQVKCKKATTNKTKGQTNGNAGGMQVKGGNTGDKKSVTGKCFNCGGKHSQGDRCPASNSKCHYCQKVGHWAKVCFAKKKSTRYQQTTQGQQQVTSREVHYVDNEPEVNDMTSGRDQFVLGVVDVQDNKDNTACKKIIENDQAFTNLNVQIGKKVYNLKVKIETGAQTRVGFLPEEIGFFRTFGRNWKKGGFFHFLPFLPEETWKKVEETPKCQLGTIIKFAVKGFLCILIQ